jgi:predicted aspartyl protease
VSAVKNALLCFLGLCFSLQTVFAGAQQVDIGDATARAELPFQVSQGFLIVVQGQVGRVSKLRFILDTGTSQTVVDKRVARKLGIRGLPGKLLTIGQALDAESAIFPDVRFGSIRATNVPLLIADFSSFTEYMGGADGILGLDLLWGSRISIDFGSKKLLISSGTTEGPQRLHTGEIVCVTTTAEIQGHRVRLLVDTGMGRIVIYHDRFPQLETDKLRLIDLDHSMFVNEVMVQKVRIGETEIQHPNVLLLPKAPVGFPANVDGVMGTASLNARWLLLDFNQGKLSWKHSGSYLSSTEATTLTAPITPSTDHNEVFH